MSLAPRLKAFCRTDAKHIMMLTCHHVALLLVKLRTDSSCLYSTDHSRSSCESALPAIT